MELQTAKRFGRIRSHTAEIARDMHLDINTLSQKFKEGIELIRIQRVLKQLYTIGNKITKVQPEFAWQDGDSVIEFGYYTEGDTWRFDRQLDDGTRKKGFIVDNEGVPSATIYHSDENGEVIQTFFVLKGQYFYDQPEIIRKELQEFASYLGSADRLLALPVLQKTTPAESEKA
jgi:hypothetical protein